jgi:guanylate kinase
MTTVNRVLERLMGRKQPDEQPLSKKMEALHRSVSEVQKYEILTTNQYLKQMDIIVSILNDIQVQIENSN